MAQDASGSIALNDGGVMPSLGLGVWQTPPEETAQIVRAALDCGYRLIDTAAMYGNEEGVGEAIEGRDDVFVTTKVWNSHQGFDETLAAFDRSAKKLGREAIDLYLIHWPAPRLGRFVDSWKALVRLKEEGRARSIGVSNFNADHLERLLDETGVVPAVNQVELHPRFQQKAVRAFNQQHGIVTEAWSPLGQGQLLQEEEVARIAERHGKTPAQVILRWHLDKGIVAIPKSANPARIRENFAVFDFQLDAEDLAQMERLDSPRGRIGPDPVTADF